MKNNKSRPWPTTAVFIIGLAVTAGSIFYWELLPITSDVKPIPGQGMSTCSKVEEKAASGLHKESIGIGTNLSDPEQSMGTAPKVGQEAVSDSDSESTAETYLRGLKGGCATDPEDSIDTSSEAAQEAASKPDSEFVEVDRNLGNSGQNQDNSPETSEEATSDEVEEDDDSEPDSEFIEVDMEQSDSKQD